MTTMYCARIARPDLLRSVGKLATKLTKWTEVEDAKLFRLMCYINTSLECRQVVRSLCAFRQARTRHMLEPRPHAQPAQAG